jgi:DNA invertase Pin-like site-specific DNA recombinase
MGARMTDETIHAYSYLRFSTPEQMKGDSYRRQTALAEQYAAQHDLELDRKLTFEDVGVSAFRGRNAESGRLSYFLEAVREGHVAPGSYLLVEQLDRLSRLAPIKALNVLSSIVGEGITVVTLMDGRTYTEESLERDHTSLMMAVLTFIRANEESEVKSRRVKHAWENKRSRMATETLTARVPGWLHVEPETRRLVVNEERAAIVRRMFDMAKDGVGHNKIAETLNREAVAPWGRGRHWHKSYVAKVLCNPAVIGTFTPSTLEHDGAKAFRKPLAPVHGYFPAVIDHETWQEVQSARRGAPRGRHSAGPVTSVLAGLAVCPLCGGTVTRVNKGKKSLASLVCSRAKAGAGCSYRSIRYDAVEQAIRSRLPERLAHAPAGGSGENDAMIANVDAQLDALHESLEQTAAELARAYSPALADALRRMETERDALRTRLVDLLEARIAAYGPSLSRRIDELSTALRDADVPTVNQGLRQLFSRVVVDWRHGELEFAWRHGGDTSVPFMWPQEA